MGTLNLVRILPILTGALLTGEAIALLVGMRWLSPGGNPWISVKNDLFLGLDIAAGTGMIYLAVALEALPGSGLFRGLVLVSLLAHGYRDWEYLVSAGNRFCTNGPLFVVNNVKLAGLLAIAILMLV
jgi:hypothetical protein